MGCIYSRYADEPLLRPSLPVTYVDQTWGPIYMSSDLSRHIRNECQNMTISEVYGFMKNYPELTFEIGDKNLAYRRIYKSPNHIRFCLGPDQRVLIVIYG